MSGKQTEEATAQPADSGSSCAEAFHASFADLAAALVKNDDKQIAEACRIVRGLLMHNSQDLLASTSDETAVVFGDLLLLFLEPDLSLQAHKKCLFIVQSIMGKTAVMALFYSHLSDRMKQQARHADALEYCGRELLLHINQQGLMSEQVATSHFRLGILYSLVEDREEAHKELLIARGIRKKLFGEESLPVAECDLNLGTNEESAGAHATAYHFYYQCFRCRFRLVGADNVLTQQAEKLVAGARQVDGKRFISSIELWDRIKELRWHRQDSASLQYNIALFLGRLQGNESALTHGQIRSTVAAAVKYSIKRLAGSSSSYSLFASVELGGEPDNGASKSYNSLANSSFPSPTARNEDEPLNQDVEALTRLLLIPPEASSWATPSPTDDFGDDEDFKRQWRMRDAAALSGSFSPSSGAHNEREAIDIFSPLHDEMKEGEEEEVSTEEEEDGVRAGTPFSTTAATSKARRASVALTQRRRESGMYNSSSRPSSASFQQALSLQNETIHVQKTVTFTAASGADVDADDRASTEMCTPQAPRSESVPPATVAIAAVADVEHNEKATSADASSPSSSSSSSMYRVQPRPSSPPPTSNIEELPLHFALSGRECVMAKDKNGVPVVIRSVDNDLLRASMEDAGAIEAVAAAAAAAKADSKPKGIHPRFEENPPPPPPLPSSWPPVAIKLSVQMLMAMINGTSKGVGASAGNAAAAAGSGTATTGGAANIGNEAAKAASDGSIRKRIALDVMPSVEGSLWDEPFELFVPWEVLFADFEDEFLRAKPAKIDRKSLSMKNSKTSGSGTQGRVLSTQKAREESVLDPHRVQNLSIMLAKFGRKNIAEISNAVRSFDGEALGLSAVLSLSQFLPTGEEISLVNAHAAKLMQSSELTEETLCVKLGKAECFIYTFAKVTALEQRLVALSSCLSAQETAQSIQTGAEAMLRAVSEVRSSSRLRYLLKSILDVGNAVNNRCINP